MKTALIYFMRPSSGFAIQLYQAPRNTDSYKTIVEEIQRDARHGTVPVEDVKPLLNSLVRMASYKEALIVDGSFDEPCAAASARYVLEPFRAKHPNLFAESKSNALTPHDRNNLYGHPDTD